METCEVKLNTALAEIDKLKSELRGEAYYKANLEAGVRKQYAEYDEQIERITTNAKSAIETLQQALAAKELECQRLDDKLSDVMNKHELLEQYFAEAKSVIEFYGDKKNHTDYAETIPETPIFLDFGFKAREFLSKLEQKT